MSKKNVKKSVVAEVKLDEKEPVMPKSKSEKRKELEAIIEAYKKQNPVKFEKKKEHLKAQLESL